MSLWRWLFKHISMVNDAELTKWRLWARQKFRRVNDDATINKWRDELTNWNSLTVMIRWSIRRSDFRSDDPAIRRSRSDDLDPSIWLSIRRSGDLDPTSIRRSGDLDPTSIRRSGDLDPTSIRRSDNLDPTSIRRSDVRDFCHLMSAIFSSKFSQNFFPRRASLLAAILFLLAAKVGDELTLAIGRHVLTKQKALKPSRLNSWCRLRHG